MSRSVKKHPVVKDKGSGKWGKRQASKAVRRSKSFDGSGKEYKKLYNSGNIYDYISYYSKEDAIKDWKREELLPVRKQRLHKKYQILEKWLIAWEKMMIKK